MTQDQRESCHIIIHGASATAAGIGGGLAQLPLTDSAALLPLQIAMVVSLGAVFDQDISDTAAKGFVLGAGAGYLGRGLSQLIVGWVPVLGNAINASTAAGLTEAIGWAAAKKFDQDS